MRRDDPLVIWISRAIWIAMLLTAAGAIIGACVNADGFTSSTSSTTMPRVSTSTSTTILEPLTEPPDGGVSGFSDDAEPPPNYFSDKWDNDTYMDLFIEAYETVNNSGLFDTWHWSDMYEAFIFTCETVDDDVEQYADMLMGMDMDAHGQMTVYMFLALWDYDLCPTASQRQNVDWLYDWMYNE